MISVIVPVHNGAKYIEKTTSGILSQDYENIELILVENFSSDDSYSICRRIADSDPRVRLLKCEEKGTSMARKMGIEHSAGKYIIFSDQDDAYVNRKCFTRMHNAISEDGAQITQFCFYVKYWGFIKRKVHTVKKNLNLTQAELYSSEAYSICGVGDGNFSSGCLWSKIYDADLLRNACADVCGALYHGEDVNLNIRAYFSPRLVRASARTDAFYIWSRGIGFSSKDPTNMALFRDYEYVKEAEFRLIPQYGLAEKLTLPLHKESMNFYNFIVYTMIRRNYPEVQILDRINEMNTYTFIQNAKQYFSNHSENESMNAFTSISDASEYLSYARRTLPKLSPLEKVRFWISEALSKIEKE